MRLRSFVGAPAKKHFQLILLLFEYFGVLLMLELFFLLEGYLSLDPSQSDRVVVRDL